MTIMLILFGAVLALVLLNIPIAVSLGIVAVIAMLTSHGLDSLPNVALVVCLDSGAGNYDQLWLTTSLRGMATGTLKVEILTEGIHSGDASGLVPSSFRIMRQVLDRLEDSATGRLLPQSFHCEVPADRLAQARARAAVAWSSTQVLLGTPTENYIARWEDQ